MSEHKLPGFRSAEEGRAAISEYLSQDPLPVRGTIVRGNVEDTDERDN